MVLQKEGPFTRRILGNWFNNMAFFSIAADCHSAGASFFSPFPAV
jgi:hypothetical protein